MIERKSSKPGTEGNDLTVAKYRHQNPIADIMLIDETFVLSLCDGDICLFVFFNLYKLGHLERGNLKKENASIRLLGKHVYVAFTWLKIDMGGSRPLWAVPPLITPLGVIRQGAECELEIKSLICVPSWLPGSCL